MKEVIAILVLPLTILVMGVAFAFWLIGGLEDWYQSRFG
jgi:hypothetical protein